MLEADRFELAADVISARATTENFPVALRILSAEQRRHLMAIYRYARLTDQIGDAAHGNRLAMLDELQRQVDTCVDVQTNVNTCVDAQTSVSAGARHPIIDALSPTIRECGLPIGPFHRLI
ncbi:MAG: squalene/phytoene synthase family protein, partial [Myxococcota bacterium]